MGGTRGMGGISGGIGGIGRIGRIGGSRIDPDSPLIRTEQPSSYVSDFVT